MRFLVDSMLPPEAANRLNARGHDALTPTALGAHSLPDGTLILIASQQGLVIVTENANDFARANTCAVLLVRKAWWPQQTLARDLATAVDRWARAYPTPGPWAHWLDAPLR